jgi:hypothetical protein
MAFPQSSYKTIPASTTTSPTAVYQAPAGFTALVLMAQVVNKGLSSQDFTLSLVRNSVSTNLRFEQPVASKAVLNVLGGSAGSLVLESGDSLRISGSSTDLVFTLSLVETPN